MNSVFRIQIFLYNLLKGILHTRYTKVRPGLLHLFSFQYFKQMQPTYHIVREVRIAYHRYATGAFHVLIRIGPEQRKDAQLMPLQDALFQEVMTEDLSFYALEEEPVIDVELHCSGTIFSREQIIIEHVLKKEQETRFVFLLQTPSNETCHVSLVISYP